MRNCPSIKWNPSVQNSPVTYSTIRPTPPISNSTEYPLSRISNPSRFIMMIETLPATNGYSLSSGGEFTTRVKPLTRKGASLRHNYTVNALFADYSAKQMSWKDLEKGLAYWNAF